MKLTVNTVLSLALVDVDTALGVSMVSLTDSSVLSLEELCVAAVALTIAMVAAAVGVSGLATGSLSTSTVAAKVKMVLDWCDNDNLV